MFMEFHKDLLKAIRGITLMQLPYEFMGENFVYILRKLTSHSLTDFIISARYWGLLLYSSWPIREKTFNPFMPNDL
jgi:hypothetical protein